MQQLRHIIKVQSKEAVDKKLIKIEHEGIDCKMRCTPSI